MDRIIEIIISDILYQNALASSSWNVQYGQKYRYRSKRSLRKVMYGFPCFSRLEMLAEGFCPIAI